MAGLYDRIAIRGEINSDPIGSHITKALIYLVARGIVTGAQARTALEAKLRTPLTAAEKTDFTNIVTQIAAQATNVLKLDYVERMDAMNIAIEIGVFSNEARWRSELGIT